MFRFSRARRFLVATLPLGLILFVTGPTPAHDGSPFPVDQELRFSDRPCTECCTSLLVGREASVDGSTMTSHSCDSGTDRTWIKLEPRKTHSPGSMATLWYQPKRTPGPDDPDRVPVGEIPQVAETYKFMDAAYPVMNEHQLAIGETTTGGKRELRSTEGLIDAPELYRLVLERATNAREAIRIADELTREYGYNDWGECFTFADPREVWFFEILGPGQGKIGAVWAAVRLPDDEIGVSANSHRILELDLNDTDHYMASDNVHSLAQEMGWWDPNSGEEFQFAYAYADRTSLYSRRREWRALSLLAPSLGLDANAENFPLSVKPDEKVAVQDLLNIFRDYYADTPYDMTRKLVVNRNGEAVKSPVANPFMNSDCGSCLVWRENEPSPHPPPPTSPSPNPESGFRTPSGAWSGWDTTTPPPRRTCPSTSEFPRCRTHTWWTDAGSSAGTALGGRTDRASKLSYFRYQEMAPVLREVWEPLEAEIFRATDSL